MGVTRWSSDKRVKAELRWYHRSGRLEEKRASVVRYDVIEEPESARLSLMHPDGTEFRIEATDEGLRIYVWGRFGGGVITSMPAGNVIEIVNLHNDYSRRLLNLPIREKSVLETVIAAAEVNMEEK